MLLLSLHPCACAWASYAASGTGCRLEEVPPLSLDGPASLRRSGVASSWNVTLCIEAGLACAGGGSHG